MVSTRSVVFTDGDVPLAGRLHEPDGGGGPTVVVAGSWLTVKEQMADRYAAELAGRGWTALTFDFAGFGASGGGLRQAGVRTAPAYRPGDEEAGMSFELDYYADPERGDVAQWRTEMAVLSWAHWLGFDGLAAAGAVDVPVLFVHSDGAVFPDHVRQLATRVRGPVETVWGEGEQTDWYDRPAQVAQAADAVDSVLRPSAGAAS